VCGKSAKTQPYKKLMTNIEEQRRRNTEAPKPERINELTKKLIAFREERDWRQFHKPKDLAVSLSLEAAEVLEHFYPHTKL